MRRKTTEELEEQLQLENVVMRGNTEDINNALCSDPVFKHPAIPLKYPICHFWLCRKSTSNEYYWVFWTRSESKNLGKPSHILAQNPIALLEKRPDFHQALVDSLWASSADFPKYDQEMVVDGLNGFLTMEVFEKNVHFQTFASSMKLDTNIGNWREKIFKMVVKSRVEYYQERFRLSRNDHYLKMALFWRELDWQVLSVEHFAVMVMCFFKQIDLNFVDSLLRTHYSS